MPSRKLQYAIVDAFTKKVFGGNPAAVVILEHDHDLTSETMQLIGREFNLSETAFVTRSADNKDEFGLRWFTPAVEAEICGHATLASAHVLFSDDDKERTITFKTRWAGDLTVKKTSSGALEMVLPATSPIYAGADLLERVRQTIAAAFVDLTGAEELVKEVIIGPQGPPYQTYMIVRLEDSVDIASLNVKSATFLELAPAMVIIITNSGPSEFKQQGGHYVCRVHCPLGGISEDPVTGSAHSFLAPYWSRELGLAGQPLKSKQVSTRGGDVEVEWNEGDTSVKVRGYAASAATGTIIFP